jgi:hypothetical protein
MRSRRRYNFDSAGVKNKILNKVFEQTPSVPLYHYTTQTGLLGILKDKEIWATHTQYLNDTREGTHALEMVRAEIQSLLRRRKDVTSRAVLKEMELDVRGTGQRGVREMDGNVCVCSFSEDSDSLSQWRAYAPASAGFAIGVSGEQLRALVAKEKFYLARCIYERWEQEALVRALVAEVFDENIKRRTENVGDDTCLPVGGNLHAYLHRYAPILKDPAFAGEREWRVISRPLSCTSGRFGFREGRSMITPFYRFPLQSQGLPFELHGIVIGPTAHPALSARSVRSLVLKYSHKNVQLKTSSVPYRHW